MDSNLENNFNSSGQTSPQQFKSPDLQTQNIRNFNGTMSKLAHTENITQHSHKDNEGEQPKKKKKKRQVPEDKSWINQLFAAKIDFSESQVQTFQPDRMSYVNLHAGAPMTVNPTSYNVKTTLVDNTGLRSICFAHNSDKRSLDRYLAQQLSTSPADVKPNLQNAKYREIQVNQYDRKTTLGGNRYDDPDSRSQQFYLPPSSVLQAKSCKISGTPRFQLEKRYRGYAIYVGPGSYSPKSTSSPMRRWPR